VSVDTPKPVSERIINDHHYWGWEMQQEHLAIELRAYELFEARGYENGRDLEDWFRAESELHLNE